MAVSDEALNIILRLQGVAPYVAGMGEASGATDKFAASSKRAGAASSEAAAASEKQRGAAALVSKGMKVVGMATLAMAVGSVAAAIKWEDMGKSISQTTGLTGKSLAGMMSVIERTAKKAPYSIQEIADAAVLLKLKFGQTDSQIEHTSALLVAFAKRAGGTSKDVGTSMLSILQDFREPMSNLKPMMDELVAVSQATHKPLGDMLTVVEKFGPKFQAMGLGLTDTIKLLGIFQASGIATTMMGRGLATAITKAEKLSKAGGGSVPDIIKGHIQEIVKATSTQEAYSKAVEFFGAQVGPSLVRALFNNASALQEVEGAMHKTGGATQLLEAQQKSAGGKWQELKNQIFFVAKTIGEQLLPAFKSAMEIGSSLIGVIITLTDKGKLLGPIIFGVAAAFLAYKAAVMGAAFVQGGMLIGTVILGSDLVYLAGAAFGAGDGMAALSLAMDANPIGLIVLAVAAAIAAIVLLILHFKEVVSFLRGPWGTVLVLLAGPFVALPMLIALHFNQVKSFLTSAVNWIGRSWSNLSNVLAKPFEWLWGKASWVFKQIEKGISGITGMPGSVLKGIEGAGGSLAGTASKLFGGATGGVMPYSGLARINENGPGEVVYLPGGSVIRPATGQGSASHAPAISPTQGGGSNQPVFIEAYLELPRGAGRGLYKLITQSAAIKTARG
jgi:Phage-related minor tail protein